MRTANNHTASGARRRTTGDPRTRGVPAWKRALDLTCILLALPVAGPLLVLITIGIKLVSKGPVLYCQPRIGYRGRPFTCFKFRSMRVNSDTQVHETHFKQLMRSKKPMTKLDSYGDKRLIPLGALLRSSGLDELPQLLNVWFGDMSLVGPRPCTPSEYQDYLPRQKLRFATLPGLTGLWQVSGKNKTTFDEMIQLDIEYAERLSLGLDLKIMLRTFPVLTQEVREMLRKRRQQARTAQTRTTGLDGAIIRPGFDGKPVGSDTRRIQTISASNAKKLPTAKPGASRRELA